MKKLFIAFLTLVSVLGFGVPSVTAKAAPVRPQSLSITATDCFDPQSTQFGARVCYDGSTGYGPVVFIFSGPTTVITSFGVQRAGAVAYNYVAAYWEYIYGDANTVYVQPNLPPVQYHSIRKIGSPYCTSDLSTLLCAAAGSNFDNIRWYSNVDGGSDPYEFVYIHN